MAFFSRKIPATLATKIADKIKGAAETYAYFATEPGVPDSALASAAAGSEASTAA